MLNPDRAEIGKLFTKKFLFQTFSIGAIFLFLLSNIFQPNFWSIRPVYADVDGLGVRFDEQSYSTNLSASLTNTGTRPGQQVSTQLRAFHCRQAAGDICIPNGSSDFLTEQRLPVTINFPDSGSESRMSFQAPGFDPSCGRVQVDVGGDAGVYGGKTFSLGSDCAAPPPPPPPPGGGTAKLESSCPNNTPTLSASWNVGSGSSCNIYIQAGNAANQISAECSGSNSSITSLSPSGAVVNGGIYHLYASNGQTTVDGGQTTINCGVPPPPPPPPPSQIVCNDNEVSLSVSPSLVNVGQPINFSISGDASTFIGDNFSGGVTGCGGPWNSQTCQTNQAGNFTWTHTWKHCVGDFDHCSGICTKQASFSVNTVEVTPSPTATPPTTPTPTPPTTPTPTGSATPTPTPAITPIPTPVSTPTPVPAATATPVPAGGVTNNITNNNNNTSSSTSSSSSTSNNTNNISFGNVGVGASQPVVVVQPQVAGVSVTALPKTGLPALAWSALAFIPTGFKIRRFNKVKKDLENNPQFIWEDRQFKV